MRTAAIALAAALFAAAPKPGPAPDEEQIRGCFGEYQKALSARNGRAAVALMDAVTIEYYGRMRALALQADAAQVRKLPVLDKLMVLRLRSGVPLEKLRAMKAEDVLAMGVDQGWVGASAGDSGLGSIQVARPEARAEAVVRGKPSGLQFVFRLEGGRWKLDLVGLLAAAGPAFAAAAAQSQMPEDAFVVRVLEMATGTKLPPGIWDAPQPAGK